MNVMIHTYPALRQQPRRFLVNQQMHKIISEIRNEIPAIVHERRLSRRDLYNYVELRIKVFHIPFTCEDVVDKFIIKQHLLDCVDWYYNITYGNPYYSPQRMFYLSEPLLVNISREQLNA